MATSKAIAETIDGIDNLVQQAINLYGEAMTEAINLSIEPKAGTIVQHVATMTRLGKLFTEINTLLQPF